MTSPELALARDYLRRGALIIPLMWLAMFGIALWIMMWLVSSARVDPNAPEAIVLHVTLTMVMGFGAAVAVFQSHGKLSRFFTRPITTTRLVACQMALGMVTVALMYATGASLLNLSGVHWPILGPAIFLAASIACVLAAVWTFEGTVLGQLIACTATSVPLVIWFNRCYGARIMGDWNVMWRQPSAADALTLVGFSLVAFGVAIFGVQRIRRGDQFTLDAVVNWWRRYRARGPALNFFPSPQAAQSWYEWRAKFGVLPFCLVVVVMIGAAIGWGTGYIPTDEVLGFSLAVPTVLLLAVVPMVYGLVAGNCGREGKQFMQINLATRPVSDAFLAHGILRNCALALAGAWGAWFFSIAILVGLLFIAGKGPDMFSRAFPNERLMPFLVYSALPILSWIITAGMATIVATGRPRLWAGGLTCFFLVFIGIVLARELVTPATYQIIVDVTLGGFAILYVLTTATCFTAALRRRLISASIVIWATAAWVLYAAVMVWLLSPQTNDTIWLVHIVAFLSLAILPFAGLPLAVRWNRHR